MVAILPDFLTRRFSASTRYNSSISSSSVAGKLIHPKERLGIHPAILKAARLKNESFVGYIQKLTNGSWRSARNKNIIEVNERDAFFQEVIEASRVGEIDKVLELTQNTVLRSSTGSTRSVGAYGALMAAVVSQGQLTDLQAKLISDDEGNFRTDAIQLTRGNDVEATLIFKDGLLRFFNGMEVRQ